jgi:hypothetical protein
MTSLTCITLSTRHGSPLFNAAIALGVALAIAPTSALAEVVVRGNPKAVSIEARNASVEEVLVTLSNAFDVHYRSSTDLRKRLTGTYEGSLQKVVTQVLNGYDFFVGTGERRIEITLLGSSAASPGARLSVPTPALPISGAAPVPRQGLAAAPLPSPSGSVPTPVSTPALPTSGGAPVPRQALAAAPLPAPSGSVPTPVPTPALPTSGGAPVPRQALAAAPLPAPSGSVPRPGPPIGGMTRSLPLAAR